MKRLVIADSNIKGMVKNRRLARVVSDTESEMLGQVIENKAAFNGGQVILANPRFPAYRVCSTHAQIHDLRFHFRTMECDCGNL